MARSTSHDDQRDTIQIMPCYDSRNDPDNVRRETRAESANKINLLTRVACDLAAVLQRRGPEEDLQPAPCQWIAEHAAWDKGRRKL